MDNENQVASDGDSSRQDRGSGFGVGDVGKAAAKGGISGAAKWAVGFLLVALFGTGVGVAASSGDDDDDDRPSTSQQRSDD